MTKTCDICSNKMKGDDSYSIQIPSDTTTIAGVGNVNFDIKVDFHIVFKEMPSDFETNRNFNICIDCQREYFLKACIEFIKQLRED